MGTALTPVNAMPVHRTMASTTPNFSHRRFCSLGIALLVVLLVPRAHVQPVAVPQHEELPKIVAFQSAKVSDEVGRLLSAKGFSTTSVDRMQKCATLAGRSLEAKLQSRVMWLLHLNQSQAQVAEAVATCSPIIFGVHLVAILKQSVQWFLGNGLAQGQLTKVFTTRPSILCSGVEQNLEPTVQWLLDLGLSKRQILKAFVRCPEICCFSIKQNSRLYSGYRNWV